MVDTGNLYTTSNNVEALALFYVCGPFSAQSEWAFMTVQDAAPLAAAGGPVGAPHNRSFHGGYVQLSYFLTGERRTYDRRLGRLDSHYFTGPAPHFLLTRDDNRGPAHGPRARGNP